MKRTIALLVFVVLLISSASAEIMVGQQPKKVYNLGEVITIPVTVKSLTDVSDVFEMNLICSGQELNFYRNGVGLTAGQEQKIDSSLILTKKVLNGLKGDCLIKAVLKDEYVLTDSFKISGTINLNYKIQALELNPGESIIITGTAIKESGKEVDGFVQIEASSKTDNTKYIDQLASINLGAFSISIPAPENMRAGIYPLRLTAYERDSSGEITNQGTSDSLISIKQVARNLEIIIETPEVIPGSSVKFKTILHDQTGDNIASNSSIKIRNNKDKLLENLEVPTDEFFEYKISSSEPPVEFKLLAENSGLSSESVFKIKEKEDIKIKISNQTLIITNTGNVPYCNKTVLVKIGNQSLNIDLCLDVGEEAKYILSAPDGEYQVEIISDNGKLNENVALTGSTIDIREVSAGISGLTRHPLVWIFVIGIMGFFVVMIFKKGYKRIFIGFIHRKSTQNQGSKNQEARNIPPKKGYLITANPAELSLSIKGAQQEATIICLRIKNMGRVQSDPENVKETFGKITQIVRENKIAVYENQENIFLILAPARTKTFKTETRALHVAREIKEILLHHNKLFKQKIDFGISLSHGSIVAKDGPVLEFAGMGDFMTKAKRTASISNQEILLEEKVKDKLGPEIKTKKLPHEKIPTYRITDIKNRSEHEKFIQGFLSRQK